MSWLDEALKDVPSQVDEIREVPPPVEGRTLIVDGDYLAYYAAGNDDTDAGRARQNAIEKLSAFATFTGATKIVIHLTAGTSNKGWRFGVATVKPYQGQRTGHKPRNWLHLRQWMETYNGPRFKTKIWYDREADDGMAYHAAVLGTNLAVIATADKDMRMFAGIHVNWKDYHLTNVPALAYRVIDPISGKLFGHAWFWQQMLQGDTADNIPGLPAYTTHGKSKRVGEKTAERLLASANSNLEAYTVVRELYQGYYGEEWAVNFAEQAMLLWMREDQRAEVHDFLTVCDEDDEELLQAVEAIEQRLRSEQQLVESIDNGIHDNSN